MAGGAANADDRYGYRDDYRSAPQVRLGVDVVWGGYGYAPPRPPAVRYPAYYQPYPVYDQGRGHSRGKHHRKHRHSRHRGYCDD
jgi:hypothetical protein